MKKTFETVGECLADLKCKEFIMEEVKLEQKSRKDMLAKHEGISQSSRGRFKEPALKSDAFAVMEKAGNFNVPFLTISYLQIIEKKSNLSSNQRNVVNHIVGNSILKTIAFYDKQSTVLEEVTAIQKEVKQRKPRTKKVKEL